MCRNDRCIEQRVKDTDYDASMTLSPSNDSELHDITEFFGNTGPGGSNLFFKGTKTVFGRSFKGDEWKYTPTSSEPITKNGRQTGIEAIEIEQGAPYLVLLYKDFFGNATGTTAIKELHQLNERGGVDVAIINHSIESLSGIGMKNRVGTLVLIKLGDSTSKR